MQPWPLFHRALAALAGSQDRLLSIPWEQVHARDMQYERILAQAGVYWCQGNHGLRFLGGNGLERNEVEAKRLLSMAAIRGWRPMGVPADILADAIAIEPRLRSNDAAVPAPVVKWMTIVEEWIGDDLKKVSWFTEVGYRLLADDGPVITFRDCADVFDSFVALRARKKHKHRQTVLRFDQTHTWSFFDIWCIARSLKADNTALHLTLKSPIGFLFLLDLNLSKQTFNIDTLVAYPSLCKEVYSSSTVTDDEASLLLNPERIPTRTVPDNRHALVCEKGLSIEQFNVAKCTDSGRLVLIVHGACTRTVRLRDLSVGRRVSSE